MKFGNFRRNFGQFGWHSIGEIAATMEAARSREKKAEKKKKKLLLEEEIDIFA